MSASGTSAQPARFGGESTRRCAASNGPGTASPMPSTRPSAIPERRTSWWKVRASAAPTLEGEASSGTRRRLRSRTPPAKSSRTPVIRSGSRCRPTAEYASGTTFSNTRRLPPVDGAWPFSVTSPSSISARTMLDIVCAVSPVRCASSTRLTSPCCRMVSSTTARLNPPTRGRFVPCQDVFAIGAPHPGTARSSTCAIEWN